MFIYRFYNGNARASLRGYRRKFPNRHQPAYTVFSSFRRLRETGNPALKQGNLSLFLTYFLLTNLAFVCYLISKITSNLCTFYTFRKYTCIKELLIYFPVENGNILK